jgi:hypothetical protein
MAKYFDITEGPTSLLGSALDASVTLHLPDHISWDCSIAGLKFLFGFSASYPMQRETSQFRKDRVDDARNPGEQSLDSGFWLRSQASWHYGSGLLTAEPLEVSVEDAQFRYKSGGGVDPWTPGEMTLLNEMNTVNADTDTGQLTLGVGDGVIHATGTTLEHVATDGTVSAITWGGSNPIQSITSDGNRWYAADVVGLWQGDLPAGAGTMIYSTATTFTTTRTLCRYVKGRMIYVCNHEVHEVTDLDPTGGAIGSHPSVHYTHPNEAYVWSDASEGPTAIYLSGYAVDSSSVWKMGVTSTTSTVTLDQPTVVAEMPRGEVANTIYSYVGSYLMIGSSSGVRVATMDTVGSLTVGPLSVENADGCHDMVAIGKFVYATVGTNGSSAASATARPGLYRINLGQTLEGRDLLFAAAEDMTADSDVAGACQGVTYADGYIWFTVNGTGLYRQQDTFVAQGWMETGRTRLGTMEAKAWRDIRVLGGGQSNGTVTAFANISNALTHWDWSSVVATTTDNQDVIGKLTAIAPGPVPNLYMAFVLTAPVGQATTASMIGYQLRGFPAPVRTELISVPLMNFDFETDKHGNQFGEIGGAWLRYEALKALENSQATFRWQDYTTGETAEAYIEKVSLRRITPPSTGAKGNNVGGICTILLRLS